MGEANAVGEAVDSVAFLGDHCLGEGAVALRETSVEGLAALEVLDLPVTLEVGLEFRKQGRNGN